MNSLYPLRRRLHPVGLRTRKGVLRSVAGCHRSSTAALFCPLASCSIRFSDGPLHLRIYGVYKGAADSAAPSVLVHGHHVERRFEFLPHDRHVSVFLPGPAHVKIEGEGFCTAVTGERLLNDNVGNARNGNAGEPNRGRIHRAGLQRRVREYRGAGEHGIGIPRQPII